MKNFLNIFIFLAIASGFSLNVAANIDSSGGKFNMKIMYFSKHPDKKQDRSADIIFKDGKVVLIPISVAGEAKMAEKIIFDEVKNTATILKISDNKKTGEERPFDLQQVQLRNMDYDEFSNIKITTHTEFKMIEGMNCIKVVAESDDFEAVFWVTNQVKLDAERWFKYFFTDINNGKNLQDKQFGTFGIGGFPLEINFTDKKSGDKTILIITDIHPQFNDSDFSTKGFTISKK